MKYEKDYSKENNDKIYSNDYAKNINISNQNQNNNNNIIKIKQYYNAVNKSKASNKLMNDSKKSNKKININNSNSNINLLNKKNSFTNICIEKNDKINILSPTDNKNYISPLIHTEILNSIPKENNNYKNKEINVKIVADELFEKNKILENKNINIIKPRINKCNTNYLNPQNNSSIIKISTNTIRYNNNLNFNIIGNSESSIKLLNRINNKKNFLTANNSEMCLLNNKLNNIPLNYKENKKYLNNVRENFIGVNNFNNKVNKYKVKDIKYNDLKNNNHNNNNVKSINPINQENNLNININNINNYKKFKIPYNFYTNSMNIDIKKNQISKSPKGVYLKPYCIISMQNPKKKVLKSNSELKINNNINRNKNEKDNNINFISPNKNHKKTTSKSFDIYFNTSPKFYQKDDYFNFKNNIDFIKRRQINYIKCLNFLLTL